MLYLIIILLICSLLYSFKNTNIISYFTGQTPIFYIRNDRDTTSSNNTFYKLTDDRLEHNLPCSSSQVLWDVPYEPGYNGMYSDLLWHTTSPRMILYDNSLSCNNINNFVSPKPYEE